MPRKAKDIIERLSKRITKSNGCWLWNGSKGGNGYGRTEVVQRKGVYIGKQVHRIMYEHYYGKIPEGMLCLHKCDVRNCCNPKHLFIGTQYDNMRDCVNKGRLYRPSEKIRQRLPRGTNHHDAKLNERKVKMMRWLHKNGKSYAELGRLFHVHSTTARAAVIGHTWSHITEAIKKEAEGA